MKTERTITLKLLADDLGVIEDALYTAATSYLDTAKIRSQANAPKAAELWRAKAHRVRRIANALKEYV